MFRIPFTYYLFYFSNLYQGLIFCSPRARSCTVRIEQSPSIASRLSKARRLRIFSSISMLVCHPTRISCLSISLKVVIRKQGIFKSLPPSFLINGHLITVPNYISTMASSLSITSANNISLEEFKRVLNQYPALIKRVSDEKGGK